MSLLLDLDMYTHNISGGITAHFRGDIHINFLLVLETLTLLWLTSTSSYMYIILTMNDNECLTEYTVL